jgi:hypothetical protein
LTFQERGQKPYDYKFEGSIVEVDHKKTAHLLPLADEVTDLVGDAECADPECDTVYAQFQEKGKARTGVIFRRERHRSMKLAKMSKRQEEALQTRSLETQKTIRSYEAPQKVTVVSSEVTYGPSQVSVYKEEPNQQTKIFDSYLEETNGRCNPVAQGEELRNIGRTCLRGYRMGNIVLQSEIKPPEILTNSQELNPEDIGKSIPVPVFFEILKDESSQSNSGATIPASQPSFAPASAGSSASATATSPASSPSTTSRASKPAKTKPTETKPSSTSLKPALPLGPLSPLVAPTSVSQNPCEVSDFRHDDIYKWIKEDCTKAPVTKEIQGTWLKSKKKDFLAFRNLLDISERFTTNQLNFNRAPTKKDSDNERAHDLRVAREILDKQELLVYMALTESNWRNVCSSAGACGYWQFMPKTAVTFNLPVAKRGYAGPATEATLKYINYLRGRWTDSKTGEVNLKMVIASYNTGEGNTEKAAKAAKAKAKANANLKTIEEISEYSQDFWTLYNLNFLKKETKTYVPRVLAAIFMGVNPSAYGIDEVQPLRLLP